MSTSLEASADHQRLGIISFRYSVQIHWYLNPYLWHLHTIIVMVLTPKTLLPPALVNLLHETHSLWERIFNLKESIMVNANLYRTPRSAMISVSPTTRGRGPSLKEPRNGRAVSFPALMPVSLSLRLTTFTTPVLLEVFTRLIWQGIVEVN